MLAAFGLVLGLNGLVRGQAMDEFQFEATVGYEMIDSLNGLDDTEVMQVPLTFLATLKPVSYGGAIPIREARFMERAAWGALMFDWNDLDLMGTTFDGYGIGGKIRYAELDVPVTASFMYLARTLEDTNEIDFDIWEARIGYWIPNIEDLEVGLLYSLANEEWPTPFALDRETSVIGVYSEFVMPMDQDMALALQGEILVSDEEDEGIDETYGTTTIRIGGDWYFNAMAGAGLTASYVAGDDETLATGFGAEIRGHYNAPVNGWILGGELFYSFFAFDVDAPVEPEDEAAYGLRVTGRF
jgi:hypothetical protein